LKLATKRSLQQTHISQASGSGADEGTGSIPRVPDVSTDESDKEISWKSSDEEGDDDDDDEGDDGEEGNDDDDDDAQDDFDQKDERDDDEDDQEECSYDEQAFDKEDEEFIYLNLSTHGEEEMRDEESFDPIPKTPENTDDEGNGEENLETNVGREEGHDEEDEEDELYRDVEHKDTKKNNEMYYPRFTKVIIHHFMSKDPSIPRRNKMNWHYVKDDHMFTTIKLTKASVRKTKSSSDTTVTPPLTAAAGPRLSTSAKGKKPATTFKAKSLTALSKVAMIEAQQLKLATKRSLQQTHISQASGSGADEGTGSIPRVPDVPTDESDKEISWKSSDEEGDDDDDEGDDGDDGEEGNDDDDDDAQDDDGQEDEGNDEDDQEKGSDDEQASDEEEFIHLSLSTHAEEETRDEESFDPIHKTPKNTDDEGNGEKDLGMNVGREEGQDEEARKTNYIETSISI
nr:hypothetical protein [Tanacetum cinerariifolium]